MTLFEAMVKLAREHGSDTQAAAAYGMTKSQWARLKNNKQHPTLRTLDNLGLVPTYEWSNDDDTRRTLQDRPRRRTSPAGDAA